MFRKGSRIIRRIISLFIVLTISYLTINMLDNFRNHMIIKDQSENSNNNVHYIDDFTTTENNIKFKKTDMLDEYKNPYKIIIWTGEKGTPIYKATPTVCRANISCDITYDQTDHSSAHAIVFKADSIDEGHLPTNRKPFQLYSWWSSESPLHTNLHPSLDSYFNVTFHYRTDADVYAPYGSIHLILKELRMARDSNLDLLLEKKRNDKVAAWVVSNCYLKRYLYGRALIMLGLKVDTFGLCFDNRELGKGKYSKEFYDELSKYKFYLAFENSIGCKDYFTEKFWYNSLRAGVVPVVWGPKKEDILKVAPTKSFIHVDDFEHPKKLIQYLNYLASNETAYAEYLDWRTWTHSPEKIESRLRIEKRDYDLRSFCKLCSIVQQAGKRRKLNLPMQKRVIPSLHEAWLGAEDNCHK